MAQVQRNVHLHHISDYWPENEMLVSEELKVVFTFKNGSTIVSNVLYLQHGKKIST